jgi:ketosteroid isomerase-like protein
MRLLRHTSAIAVALLVTIASVAARSQACAQPGAATRDSLAILAAGKAFSSAYVSNDTAALGRVYSDSAVLLPPNNEIRGRTAIQRYFAWGDGYRQLAHSMVPERLTVSGDMAVDVGTWTSTGQRGDAEPTTASERYLIVWVREDDGAWRILYDMWHRPAR